MGNPDVTPTPLTPTMLFVESVSDDDCMDDDRHNTHGTTYPGVQSIPHDTPVLSDSFADVIA